MQIECVKCLRVLMNTDVRPLPLPSSIASLILCPQIGFTQILSRESLITYIAYSLDTPSNKLRAQVSDLLAALCILSPTIGHSHVLSALSDFRIAHAEKFRFEFFLESLSVRDGEGEEEGEGEEGAWEWRTAGFGLINAIIHGPVEVRDRILLREEFGRRGLNEIMTVRPPPPLPPIITHSIRRDYDTFLRRIISLLNWIYTSRSDWRISGNFLSCRRGRLIWLWWRRWKGCG